MIDGLLIASLVSSRCSVTVARNKLDLLMKEEYNWYILGEHLAFISGI